MIRKRLGKIVEIISLDKDTAKVIVVINGKREKAVNYNCFTGPVSVGDKVILNTNSIYLDLGTGGYHYIIFNYSNETSDFEDETGHIQKLRYTPYQVNCLTIEEEDSIYHEVINNNSNIDSLKVLICPLHSMLLPACYLLKRKENLKICYIMTDSAALPIHFSNIVKELKINYKVDYTVTCGQSFGGDYEAVNIYTALIFAKHCKKCDVAIIAPGPGVVGTSTKYGFTEIENGHIIDMVNNLGGKPYYIPRISFSDKRKNHYGISHHTITVLKDICFSKSNVAFPLINVEKNIYIKNQIKKCDIDNKHNLFFLYEDTVNFLEKNNIKVSSMGKPLRDNKEFFMAVGASVKLMQKT